LKKFLFCAICILGLLFGWGMAKFLSPSPVILQKTVAKSSPFPAHSEPVILENTRLMVRYSYGGCGHYELKEKRLPSSWIGKSASDVSLTGTLFETYENGMAIGHTDTFFEVAVPTPTPLRSELRSVRLLGVEGERLIGRIEEVDI